MEIILFFVMAYMVQAQSKDGFISLDCGLVPGDSPYIETETGLTYVSDADYIEAAGEIKRVKNEFRTATSRPYWTLRSFPEGIRNCYTLNVTKETNYLIKAGFLYGNYDDQNASPIFDLYLGPNKLKSFDESSSNDTTEEFIHVAKSDQLQFCLVKTGTTVPFISTLELRPLRNDSYVTETGLLVLSSRNYLTTSPYYIGYNDDIRDRIWYPYFETDKWTQLNTTLAVNTSNSYEVPQDAMKTAAVPSNASQPFISIWSFSNSNTKMHIYMHFAEIQELKPNDTREFNIILNGEVIYSNFSPKKLEIVTVYTTKAQRCDAGECALQLVKTPNSSLPPLINALEGYIVVEPQAETDQNDVYAVKNVKLMYGLNKRSWQGDPCVPKQYSWDGLNCSYKDAYDPPRIISVNLSSSGLTGTIPSYFQNLTHLEELDLSKNNLTGGVPDFLADMKSLLVINLSGNKLNGSVPQALLDREKDGLKLNVQGNQILYCPSGSCKNRGTRSKDDRKKILIPVIASVAALAAVAAVLVILFLLKRNKLARVDGPKFRPRPSISTVLQKERRFSYAEILRITNNFQRVLGKGGFGVVYHGCLNDNEQVAVKVLSESSTQGYKQFRAEVEILLHVHHRNLVSLVGYFEEGDKLALIYEYMANGDLKEHLSGKRGRHVFSWANRLRAAVEAAYGLEYLHQGCETPIIHRDVKTTNILLNECFQAKLSDFGLSRILSVESESHVSTVVAGTPGYLDPEYFKSNRLTEKSDVYSFGITLLEIITNRSPFDNFCESSHIGQWVGLILTRGDIKSIVDPELREDYDTNSVWRAVELAMWCVNPTPSRRPNMANVVMELKECLATETMRTQGRQGMSSKFSGELSLINSDSGLFPQPR